MNKIDVLRISASARWMTCTAAPAHNKEFGVDTTNEAALEGTAGHTVLQYYLMLALIAEGMSLSSGSLSAVEKGLEEIKEKYPVDEMREHASLAIDRAIKLVKSDPNAQAWVERSVRLSSTSDRVRGTADIIIYLPTSGHLYVIDYKYGRLPVEAERNSQITLYLIAVMQSLLQSKAFPRRMTVEIIQPRVPNPIKSWKATPEYLVCTFLPDLKAALKEIEQGGIFRPSETACRYCPSIATCPEAFRMAQQVCEFQDLDKNPDFYVTLDMIPIVRAWADAVEKAALEHIGSGHTIPGWSLKEGTTQRKWVDDDQVMAFLKKKRIHVAKYAPRGLLGIPALEQLIAGMGNKNLDPSVLAPYITKPAGKLRLIRQKTITDTTTQKENSNEKG